MLKLVFLSGLSCYFFCYLLSHFFQIFPNNYFLVILLHTKFISISVKDCDIRYAVTVTTLIILSIYPSFMCTAGVSRLERGLPPEPPRRPLGRPSISSSPSPGRRSTGRRLLLAPLLRVLLYAVLTVAVLLLLLLVAVFELDTAATRELRLFPELQLLRRRLYQPAREFVVRGVSM